MQKVLVLIPQNIIPATDGGKQGLFFPLAAIAKHKQVTVIIFINKSEKIDAAAYKTIGVKPLFLRINKSDSLILVVSNFFKRMPFKFDKFYTYKTIKAVFECCRKIQPEIVICHHAHLAQFGILLKQTFKNIKFILREHNIEYELIKQLADKTANPLVKLILQWQFKKTKEFEEYSWSYFDKVLFISNSDINIASKVKNKNFILLKDGTNIIPLKNTNKQNAFLFCGNVSSMQNEYNLRVFIKNTWIPFKSEKDNSFELWITGNDEDNFLKKMHLSKETKVKYDIKILGCVNDISVIIQQAKFFISPTILGSGIRIKVLEALGNGAIVFLMPKDYQMITIFKDLENVVLFSDASSFSTRFYLLQENNELCNRIAHNAYNLAKNQFTWEIFEKKYLSILK